MARGTPRPWHRDRVVHGLQSGQDDLRREINALQTDQRRRYRAPLYRPADSADADTSTEYLMRVAIAGAAYEAHYIPRGALTANDTNYATLELHAIDEGGTARIIGSITTETQASDGTGDWAAGDVIALTLISPAKIQVKDRLAWVVSKSGTGVSLPAGTWILAYELEE